VPVALTITLAILTSLGPITTELYTPSLPTMARYFGTSIGEMQNTISTMLFAFAVAQLLAGSLSDSLGRKPILVVGMCFYTLASMSGSLAGNIYQLELQRAIQGIGSALAMVTGQALVRDLFPDLRARERVTGRLASVRASCPLLAPIVGSWLQIAFGWRAAFVVMGMLGVIALISTRFLPTQELASRPAGSSGANAYWRNLWRTTRILARDPAYVATTGSDTLSFVGFMLYVTSASYGLQSHYGVPLSQFGLVYGINAVGLLAGTELSPRLSRCMPGSNAAVLRLGLLISLVSSVVQLLCVLAPGLRDSFWSIVLPAAACNFGRGILTVQAITLSLEDYPHLAGTATGLMFALRAILASVAVTALGAIYDRSTASREASDPLDASPVPLCVMMLCANAAACGLYAACSVVRRRGSRRHDARGFKGMAAQDGASRGGEGAGSDDPSGGGIVPALEDGLPVPGPHVPSNVETVRAVEGETRN
jgi:DHA1 family bicyclomycin/chloramphenicol resistance-like MFS transporter